MHIVVWRKEIEGLVSDFIYDYLKDHADPNSVGLDLTEDEWWEAFLQYKEATGS